MSGSGRVADGGRRRLTHTHTHRVRGRREEREEGERSIQKETGGAEVMETPLPFPLGGRNTIFLILRSNTSPEQIFPISHWR